MYGIVFTKQAAKSLLSLPRDTSRLIREKLNTIAGDPFASHPNSTKLQGRSGYRLRVGDWRIIYDVQKDDLVIVVLKIAHRSEAYR